MNAKQYYEKHGSARCRELAALAGTSYGYFRHIVFGRRFPSRKLAQKLVEASNGELDFQALLTGEEVKLAG